MKKTGICAALAALCVWLLAVPVLAAQRLVPVGQVIGLELSDGTVTIAAFADSIGDGAKAAGLQIGDEIIKANQNEIHGAADLLEALSRSDGAVELTILRNGTEHTLRVHPVATALGPKLGVYLREGISGIGTVTWYDPASGRFGALGHGVNDSAGRLLEMVEGTAYDASVQSIQKGRVGTPGLLRGQVDTEQVVGPLYANTERGIFGTTQSPWLGEALPLAELSQIHTGEASILSNIHGNLIQEYHVEILKLYPRAKQDGRNLLLRVTDPALLTTTGGIVQGMSGSPIIQDGRLVGAVTHVLVNDPTTGYGIFIENMLDAAA